MKYYTELYKIHHFKRPSSFAKFCLKKIKGKMIELGCGDYRDLNYFKKNGIRCVGIDSVYGEDVEKVIKFKKCLDYVYARFFWHAIDRKLQESILDWVSNWIFIEARTDQDKPKNLFGEHKRYLVNTIHLITLLKEKGFTIKYLEEGRGLSPFKGEDPFLIRVIAKKNAKKIS
jgi:hypothetical protein